MVYLGVLSYSIYLWHYGIVFVLREIIHPVPTFLITLGVSVAIAAVSHRFMERPLRDWANRRLSGGRGEVREALPASP